MPGDQKDGSAKQGRRHGAHPEKHRGERSGWLRAAVLGADDGLVSTASLMVGVAAAAAPRHSVLIAGVAGLVAGAMSMAAGEYVSVSSQRDTQQADLARETEEIATSPQAEMRELTNIYIQRGLDPDLAAKVSEQLMAHDALGAHARDELGYEEATRARPLQAALTSAISFAVAAAFPILILLLSPESVRIPAVCGAALLGLGILGAVGGKLGGASPGRAAFRVLIGGAAAMGITALVGRLFGVAAS